ncbi:MAG TPA: hypothetical protein VEK73_05320 [Xanthobacteraceae bacterium]|nr:hypothetical protein [Xanthobacteraceae bacterium]
MDLPIPTTVKAQLKSLSDNTAVMVHFNPASLVYTIENSNNQQSGDPTRRQFAAQFSGKLTMDLQFDTTGTGADVRQITSKVALFMQASANAGKNPSSGNPQAPPVLSFQWGSYEFKGTMDSFKETIDFFSADGVPLRSLVSIGLSRQDQVFDQGATFKTTNVSGSLVPTSASDSATSAATKGGDPSAARQLGADNGLDSLRATGGAALQVNGGIQLNAAAGFSASASVGAGAGLSIGGSAGISAGASAGISLGAGAGVSAGVSFGASAGVAASADLQLSAGAGGGALFGGQASAGVPATAGAFAGLEIGRATVSTTTRLDPLRMLRSTTSADVSTDANASFSLGGAARAQAGFSSDVGASFNFNSQLVFDSG